MRKTVTISIGGHPFVIEEDAYAMLDAYLHSIRAHFGSSPDADEIITDIENRIGEEFGEKLNKRKTVINDKDVEKLIEAMGTIEDFKEFEGDTDETPRSAPDSKRMRLYRDADDQVIAGVSAGIAKYFNIDPIIVRLFFGLSLFMGGFGALLYIILWISLPEARTTAEKVEMTGGRVTLSAIQQRIDATMPPDKRKRVIRTATAAPAAFFGAIFRGIGRIFRFLVPLAGRIVGFFATLGFTGAIAFATFVLLALLLNPGSPYIGVPLSETVGALSYTILLVSGYFLAFLPLVFGLLIAVSLLSMKNFIRLPVVASLGGLWLVALLSLAVTSVNAGPKLGTAFEEYERANQQTATQEYEFADFSQIMASGHADIEISEGAAFDVTVVGSETGIARTALTNEDGLLSFGLVRNETACVFFCPDDNLTLYVTMPSLTRLQMDGAGRGQIKGFTQDALLLELSGVPHVEADVEIQMLTVNADGAPRIMLTGSGEVLNLNLNGVARIEAQQYIADTVNIDIDGPARAYVSAKTAITGVINGPGHVEYRGEPAVTVDENGPARIEAEYDDDEYRE